MFEKKKKLASRKLWIAIFACMTALSGGFAGALDWPTVTSTVMTIVLGYLAAQGIVDVAIAIKKD